MQSRLFDKCPVAAVTVSMILGIIIAHYVSLPITILPVLAGMVVVALLLYKFANAQSVTIVLPETFSFSNASSCCSVLMIVGLMAMLMRWWQPCR